MIQTLFITLTMMLSGYSGFAILPSPGYMKVEEIEPIAKLSSIDESEILWLARVIFSETKNEDEMKLVGWVVRNRVDTKYRGSTYKEVALSASQFSGLNKKDEQYSININMGYGTKNEKWIKALLVANEIYFANENKRPFSKNVKHFYSPVSVGKTPQWTKDGKLDYTIPGKDGAAARFAFYRGVK